MPRERASALRGHDRARDDHRRRHDRACARDGCRGRLQDRGRRRRETRVRRVGRRAAAGRRRQRAAVLRPRRGHDRRAGGAAGMTNLPEENTLGVVVGKARDAVGATARRLGRAASAHRASLGTAFLGLGAAIIVGVRGVYGAIRFGAQWDGYPEPWAALAAWIVLVTVLVAAIVMVRVAGDRLPDWMFGLVLTGLAAAVALDVIAARELHDIGRTATAALTAGRALRVGVTLRGSRESLAAAAVLGLARAAVVFFNAPVGSGSDGDWSAAEIVAIALTVR